MPELPSSSLNAKLDRVVATLRHFGRAVIAFSGGVDSTLLAKLARDVLGKANALAVTADSPSLTRRELHETQALARSLDLDHLIIQTSEVADASYQANTPGRCYVCKRTLFVELEELAAARQMSAVLYGAIGDDQLSERPGQRAALAYGVRAPLQEAGLAKWDVRELARQHGLPNWNKPQNACLSSRIPHGLPVTEHALKQIEQAEEVLLQLGFCQVRVRHLGVQARIEVGQDEVRRFDDVAMRVQVQQQLAGLGFAVVTIDPDGYRPGGANAPHNSEHLSTAA